MSDAITSVYRYYDGRGALLYVGITSRGINRNYEHNLTQEWWPFAAVQHIEHYERRDDAERRERELIREFRPPFNSAHNPDHESFRAAYLMSYGRHDAKPRIPLAELEKSGRWREIPLHITARQPGFIILTSAAEYVEVLSRVVWGLSQSRIVMEGCDIGALHRTYVNDDSVTWHYEIAEEITEVAEAHLFLKRAGTGRNFAVQHIALLGEKDLVLAEANRSAGNSIAQRYPLKKARKQPKNTKVRSGGRS